VGVTGGAAWEMNLLESGMKRPKIQALFLKIELISGLLEFSVPLGPWASEVVLGIGLLTIDIDKRE
jgi:hypothetical protein